jgi:DnaJ family protein A protein 2
MFHSLFTNPIDTIIIDNERLYECLEVSRDVNENQIKKAYYRLARVHHPDKGGNPEKFKEIHRAYEILSDKQQRSIYDRHGEDGLLNSPPHSSSFPFGAMFGFYGEEEEEESKPVSFHLRVTLDDLYKGVKKTLRMTEKLPCGTCLGIGGSHFLPCQACTGIGRRLSVRPIGPGMMQQVYVECTDCAGSGQYIPRESICIVCKGQKNIESYSPLEVVIEPGMVNGTKIFIPTPGKEDVVVVVILEELPHDRFIRRGLHLFMKCEITLYESILGIHRNLIHVDGSIVPVQSIPGMVLAHGSYYRVRGKGLPPSGDLFLEIRVVFPKTVPLHIVNMLRTHLVEEESKEEDVCFTLSLEEKEDMDELLSVPIGTEKKEDPFLPSQGCRTQ